MSKMSLQFLNHAALKIAGGDCVLLTDPWFFGGAFDDGWELQYEFEEAEVESAIAGVTHIWISHEHPDHFSVGFFKRYASQLIAAGIKVMFQETKDGRVVKFLEKVGFEVIELAHGDVVRIGDEFSVCCFKDGFYDSGLMINVHGVRVLNLNDCEINTRSRCQRLRALVGDCDILCTQFSYAAWKGGANNRSWRERAARTKLETIEMQAIEFSASTVVPFASHIHFCTELNSCLNDGANTLRTVRERFEDDSFSVAILKPFQFLDLQDVSSGQSAALAFWDDAKAGALLRSSAPTQEVSVPELTGLFEKYVSRIWEANSHSLAVVVSRVPFFKVFQPVVIQLLDLDVKMRVDLLGKSISITEARADLALNSRSLKMIFANSFGFDTLTVNGCFEEISPGGFEKAARTLAIENLNNLGVTFDLTLIARLDIVGMFLSRLLGLREMVQRTS